MVELAIAMVVAALLGVVAWQFVSRILNPKTGALQGARRRAERALAEARLMEVLMQDLRSSVDVVGDPATGYLIERYVPTASGDLELRVASWRKRDETTVVRELEGGRATEFSFAGLLDDEVPILDLRLEPVRDVLFEP